METRVHCACGWNGTYGAALPLLDGDHAAEAILTASRMRHTG
jgi:hypothetical protein